MWGKTLIDGNRDHARTRIELQSEQRSTLSTQPVVGDVPAARVQALVVAQQGLWILAAHFELEKPPVPQVEQGRSAGRICTMRNHNRGLSELGCLSVF